MLIVHHSDYTSAERILGGVHDESYRLVHTLFAAVRESVTIADAAEGVR